MAAEAGKIFRLVAESGVTDILHYILCLVSGLELAKLKYF